MIVYKINVLQELKHKGYSTYVLRRDRIMGEAQIQKIRQVNLLVKKLSIQSVNYYRYSPETCLNMWRRYRC